MTGHADGRTKPWAVYLVVVLISFVAAAGITTLYSMLPTLYREFGGRHGAGWAVTAYFLIAAISAALRGRLGDLLGRRFMSLVVLGLAALGALLSSLGASSLTLLIAGCALQGTAGYRILASDTVTDAAHGAATFPSNVAFTRAFIYVACASLACLVMVRLQRHQLRIPLTAIVKPLRARHLHE